MRADLLLGLGLRGAGAVSSFALAWMIAQVFGARTVGLYQIGFTTATFLTAIAVLSQDVVVVRQIAPLLKSEREGEAARRFIGTRQVVLIGGIALAILAALLAYPLAVQGIGDAAAGAFIIALAPAIILLPQMRIHNALLRCMGRVTLSQTLEGVSYTTFAMVGLAILWLAGDIPDALVVPALVVTGLTLSALTGFLATARTMSTWPQEGPPLRPDLMAGLWIAASTIVSQAGNWLVLLIITALMSAAEGGIFRIAVLTCTLMQLINTSFATMAGPYLARAADAGDMAQMRRTILTAGGIGAAIAAPVVIVALFLPEFVMGLFGPEFVSGAVALQLLAVSQLVNVAAGPVGIALIMQKRERLVLGIELCATVLGVVLTVLLIPGFGLAGAGIGMLAAAVLRNGINWLFCWFGWLHPRASAA